MMNIFLEHVQTVLADRHCLLVLDQAGWRNSMKLQIPQNIELVFFLHIRLNSILWRDYGNG
jgi:hypothetical protein